MSDILIQEGTFYSLYLKENKEGYYIKNKWWDVIELESKIFPQAFKYFSDLETEFGKLPKHISKENSKELKDLNETIIM